MKLNKKGGDQVMAWGLLFIMFLVVVTSAVYIRAKTNPFTSKTGEVQSEMVKNYHNGELALIYVDQAAKYSIDNSIYMLTKNGGYFNEPSCKHAPAPFEGYVLWKDGFKNPLTQKAEEELCYPTKSDLRKSFKLFFNEQFNDYAEKYEPTLIPKNNYDPTYDEKENSLEIKGIATQKIRFPPDRDKYKQKVFEDLKEKWQDCLLRQDHYPSLLVYGPGIQCRECSEKTTCGSYNSGEVCKIDPCNIGCRKDNLKCKKANSVYAVSPSFKTETSYNFFKKFNEYVEKTKEIEENVIECLKQGSYKANDGDDLQVCVTERLKQEIKDIEGTLIPTGENAELIPFPDQDPIQSDNNIKKVEDIENYEITAITSEADAELLSDPDIKLYANKVYTLLFEIKDDSFQNPYSDEELIIKYGIRFVDEFPPPATEIITDEDNKPLKKDGAWYLIWENKASDVFGYEIYYSKIEDNKFGEGEIPSSPPTDILDIDSTYKSIQTTETELLLTGFEEGDYYFFIIAGDDANNVAKDIITKRVSIPSIEESQEEGSLLVLFPE